MRYIRAAGEIAMSLYHTDRSDAAVYTVGKNVIVAIEKVTGYYIVESKNARKKKYIDDDLFVHIIRKAAHFTEFTFLGAEMFLMFQTFERWKKRVLLS